MDYVHEFIFLKEKHSLQVKQVWHSEGIQTSDKAYMHAIASAIGFKTPSIIIRPRHDEHFCSEKIIVEK